MDDLQQPIDAAAPRPRNTYQAHVRWGARDVTVGGDAPVRVQSMTNTDTVDAIGTAIQVKELALAGSEMVRITVNTPEAAQAVPYIREQLDRMGIDVPLVGDFHYNGHRLLTEFPDCAQALSKYRINPGNVGKGDKRDRQFGQMIEAAVRWNKAVRIGVNWGSLDQQLLADLMDENSRRAVPWGAKPVMYQALITSALESAKLAESMGLPPEQIILSCKVSGVQDLISVYRALSQRCRYALHLGLTEAGMGTKGTGVVPMIDRLALDCPVALAVSLHAPNDPLRDNLVPLNKKYPLDELLQACNRYLAHAPRDFITFEYCMLDGVNDQPEHAQQLIALVQQYRGSGVWCKFNLIPFNPFPASGLLRSPMARVSEFAKMLSDAGIVTTVRKTRGDDIDAACGQLAGDVKDRTQVVKRMAQQRVVMMAQVPPVVDVSKGA